MVFDPVLRAGTPRRMLLGLTVVAAFSAFIWFGRVLVPTYKPASAVPAQSFVWSDRIPLTRAMLAQWLRTHGASYPVWAKRHPAAAQRLSLKNTQSP
jgi:hypothetical protein